MITSLKELLPDQYKFREICSILYDDAIKSYVVTWEDESYELLKVSNPKNGMPLYHITIGKLYLFDSEIIFRYYLELPQNNPQERKFSYFEIFELSKCIKEIKEEFFKY
jgi:hypothetical protein